MKKSKKDSDVEKLKKILKKAKEALEVSMVWWPIIRTRDCGTCSVCGHMTSSGSIIYCSKCACKICKTAISEINEIL